MPFDQSDWDELRRCFDRVVPKLERLGAAIDGPRFYPPIDASVIHDWEQRSGHRTPSGFADLTTRFCGGWDFNWSLIESDLYRTRTTAFCARGGTWSCPFLGLSDQTSLCQLCDEWLEEILEAEHEIRSECPETFRSLPAMIPLETYDNGDYTVLRCDASPSQVVRLGHESLWDMNEDPAYKTSDFRSFLLDWASSGFVRLGSFFDDLRRAGKRVDYGDPRVKASMPWLN